MNQTQTTKTSIEALSVLKAFEQIGEFYKREFNKLSIRMPLQLVDGCVVEFFDEEQAATVAAARLRLMNYALINNQTGQIHIEACLTDLAFTRSTMTFTVKLHREEIPKADTNTTSVMVSTSTTSTTSTSTTSTATTSTTVPANEKDIVQ